MAEHVPCLPKQPGYHKRLKNAEALLCKTILILAVCRPSWFDDLWITDATPVPRGMSREAVKRSDLAGNANYGYCASHSRWYWGLKLYLVCVHRGRDAGHVVPGRPQDPRTRGAGSNTRQQPPPDPQRSDPVGRQGVSGEPF
ncbi:hypothetical protein Atai01_23490 [Amycolatopsis taiwanensis]|uniref:Uncharacterized protein n=1 Tax=Amycolatopsis taiwanensis TaxID=342230 RepID=A0A9W6QZK3_9PSEU|nr:hypothetical protein Atai01_23490 [Amycolatopsis taiwanensis]